MKTRKFIFNILVISLILGGVVSFLRKERFQTEAAEGIEIDGGSLTEDAVYDTSAYISNTTIYLNNHTITVNGDLEINGNVQLGTGKLVVNGNVLQTGGHVSIEQGIMEVSGDYIIQNKSTLSDGTVRYLDCYGYVDLYHENGILKINGDFILRNLKNWCAFSEGIIEIGGNVIQEYGAGFGSIDNGYFRSNPSYGTKVRLTGNKNHKIEIESESCYFYCLESEGKITWKGYMSIVNLLSNLEVESEKGMELTVGTLGVGNKYLSIIGDVRSYLDINTGYGKLRIEGNLLQANGGMIVRHGTIEITGDYRIQDSVTMFDGTARYIGSSAYIYMDCIDGKIEINGDFVTQSSWGSPYSSGFSSYENRLKAGTMEIGGDIIQINNGDVNNFYCYDTHKVILVGEKPQEIRFENEKAQFATLVISRSISNYTFNRIPCWTILEESAISIEDCTIKSIAKKAYTGKAIQPALTITYNGIKLVKGTDYTVKYSNNKKTGKATVTITGIGAYTGATKKTFQIVPAKLASIKATSESSKTVKLTWKKDSNASGYVIEYSTDKNFRENVGKITIKKNTTVSKDITKLTSKKTYYFRIRAYKTIDGKKAYGSYSAIKSVKVK